MFPYILDQPYGFIRVTIDLHYVGDVRSDRFCYNLVVLPGRFVKVWNGGGFKSNDFVFLADCIADAYIKVSNVANKEQWPP